MKPKLSIVPEQPLDITAALRADISKRNWSAVHVSGDRSPALPWMERVKRTWIR